jgi:hypothetical protein
MSAMTILRSAKTDQATVSSGRTALETGDKKPPRRCDITSTGLRATEAGRSYAQAACNAALVNAGRELLMIVKPAVVIRSGPLTSPSARPRSHSDPPTRPQERSGSRQSYKELRHTGGHIEPAAKFSRDVAGMAQIGGATLRFYRSRSGLPDFITTHQGPRVTHSGCFRNRACSSG